MIAGFDDPYTSPFHPTLATGLPRSAAPSANGPFEVGRNATKVLPNQPDGIAREVVLEGRNNAGCLRVVLNDALLYGRQGRSDTLFTNNRSLKSHGIPLRTTRFLQLGHVGEDN